MRTVPSVQADVHEAYVDSVESKLHPFNHVEFKTALTTIRGVPGEDVELLRLLLKGLSIRHGHMGQPSPLGYPARVEVFYEFEKPEYAVRRGLLLFNHQRQPLLHVLNATMDNSPSSREPNLTAKVLEFIGAPLSLFHYGLGLIDQHPFLLVFSREHEDAPYNIGPDWRVERLR